ncbi:MAG: hypothetical protein ACRD5H_11250 [Nitrososphaerales archaeon]
MPYHRSHKEILDRVVNELAKSGEYRIKGEKLREIIKSTADSLGLDLSKPYDIEKTRKILGKGTAMSEIVSELRKSAYEELS